MREENASLTLFSSNQRGVAIIINTNFEYKIITKNKKDDN
jgi:hypothetical protein